MTDFLAFDGEDEPEEEEEDEGGSEDEDDGPNYGKIEDEDFTARKESDLEGVRYMNNRGVEALLREVAAADAAAKAAARRKPASSDGTSGSVQMMFAE